MPDSIDWDSTTFEGNRLRQHQEFRSLSLREKFRRVEAMYEVVARLSKKHRRSPGQQDTEHVGE